MLCSSQRSHGQGLIKCLNSKSRACVAIKMQDIPHLQGFFQSLHSFEHQGWFLSVCVMSTVPFLPFLYFWGHFPLLLSWAKHRIVPPNFGNSAHLNILECKYSLSFPSRRRTSRFKRCKTTILFSYSVLVFYQPLLCCIFTFRAKPNFCLSANTVDTFIGVPKMAFK